MTHHFIPLYTSNLLYVHSRHLLSVLLIGCIVTACNSDSATTKTTTTSNLNSASTRQVMVPESANLHLHISNQSFSEDKIEIEVKINSEQIVRDRFAVEGQHNWKNYYFIVKPGEYKIEFTSSSGIVKFADMEIPTDGIKYAALSYWYYPADQQATEFTPRSFEFFVSDTPIRFD